MDIQAAVTTTNRREREKGREERDAVRERISILITSV
jgi:hypothetical protein